jgi:hypothetical protein
VLVVDTAVSAAGDVFRVDVEFEEHHGVDNPVVVKENATRGNKCRHCLYVIYVISACLFIGGVATMFVFSPTAGLTIASFLVFLFAIAEVIKTVVVVVAVAVMEEVVVSAVRWWWRRR